MNARTETQRRHSDNGTVILTALIIILLVTTCAAVMMKTAIFMVKGSKHRGDFIRARTIAESGAHEAFAALEADFTLCDDPAAFPVISFGEGEYDVTVTRLASNVAQVSAKGRYDRAETEVVLDVMKAVDDDPGLGALDYTFYAAQDIFMEQSSRLTSKEEEGSVGAVYAGRDFQVRVTSWLETTAIDVGNKISVLDDSRIYGIVTSPDVYLAKQSITECFRDEYNPVSPRKVEFPILDLVSYYRQAQRNGQVLRQHGEVEIPAQYVIPGGVRWYETEGKDLIITNDANWTGCIIATGNIIFEKDIKHSSAFRSDGARLPAIMSRDGKIIMKSSGDMYGLVYAPGDIEVYGSIKFLGTMVSGGTILFDASFGGVTYDRYEPPTIGTKTSLVHVSAWQK